MAWMIGGSSANRGGNFSLHHRVQISSGAHPASYSMGALSLEVKRLGHKAEHSPPPSAEVKNVCSYTSTPQYTSMAWCSIKNTGTTLPLCMVSEHIHTHHRNYVLLQEDTYSSTCVHHFCPSTHYCCQVTPHPGFYITPFQFQCLSKILQCSFPVWSDNTTAVCCLIL
jgi:hypothetical protein